VLIDIISEKCELIETSLRWSNLPFRPLKKVEGFHKFQGIICTVALFMVREESPVGK